MPAPCILQNTFPNPVTTGLYRTLQKERGKGEEGGGRGEGKRNEKGREGEEEEGEREEGGEREGGKETERAHIGSHGFSILPLCTSLHVT